MHTDLLKKTQPLLCCVYCVEDTAFVSATNTSVTIIMKKSPGIFFPIRHFYVYSCTDLRTSPSL